MKKRLIAMVLTLVLLAACAMPAMAQAPAVKEIEYKGSGVVEVEFTSEKVKYKSAKVVVKDADGNKLTARITEKDNDDIKFKVTGLEKGARYTFKITGIRKGSSGSWGSVSGSFKTPSDKPKISKVTYDSKDKDLEVDFATKVQFKSLKVTVKDSKGNKLTVKNIEKGDDDLEMTVKGMKSGKKYTITVKGVRVRGTGSYITVTKTFTA